MIRITCGILVYDTSIPIIDTIAYRLVHESITNRLYQLRPYCPYHPLLTNQILITLFFQLTPLLIPSPINIHRHRLNHMHPILPPTFSNVTNNSTIACSSCLITHVSATTPDNEFVLIAHIIRCRLH